jgi:hypothetical protein
VSLSDVLCYLRHVTAQHLVLVIHIDVPTNRRMASGWSPVGWNGAWRLKGMDEFTPAGLRSKNEERNYYHTQKV